MCVAGQDNKPLKRVGLRIDGDLPAAAPQKNRLSRGCGCVVAAVAKASCPSLALAEMVKRLWLMPPQFQWTGIGGMALYSHSRGGQRIKGDLAFIAVE